jgi:hypothetical protein
MKFKARMGIAFVALFVMLVLSTCFLVSSCQVLKNKRTTSLDSTSVRREITEHATVDSGGSVSKSESLTKSQYDRTTFLFQDGFRTGIAVSKPDTNVINLYNTFPQPVQPYKSPQPYAIIHETGTNEQSNKTVDSNWHFKMESLLIAFMDSTNKKLSESTKTKETKEPWLSSLGLILLMIGILVLWEFIKQATSKYRIVKK